MASIRIKLQTGVFPGFADGQEITLECDSEATPVSSLWRRRIDDALHKTRPSKTPSLVILEPEKTAGEKPARKSRAKSLTDEAEE